MCDTGNLKHYDIDIMLWTLNDSNTFGHYSLAVVEIKVRNWSAIFFEDRTFCRLLIAFPLKMYNKFSQPKWILVGQMLKLVRNGQWAAVISSTGCIHVVLNFNKINEYWLLQTWWQLYWNFIIADSNVGSKLTV